MLLTGCASQLMLSTKDQQLPSLLVDKSRIIFIRSTFHGHLYAAGIYEIVDEKPTFIAAIDNKNKFYFDMKPGEHAFLSTGTASMRFLRGNFEAGKTYYAVVRPRGWPGISFELSPVRAKGSKGVFYLNSDEYNNILANSVYVKLSPEAIKWADGRKESLRSEYAEEWPLWKNQPDDFKARFTFRSSDGT